MSGAHDTKSVYTDEQDNITSFDQSYEQYRERISKYLSLKVNPKAAEDLTQQVFLRAVETFTALKVTPICSLGYLKLLRIQ